MENVNNKINTFKYDSKKHFNVHGKIHNTLCHFIKNTYILSQLRLHMNSHCIYTE